MSTKKNGGKKKNTPAVKTEAAMPVDAGMFETDAGMGMEGADKDSFAIPFLTILQPLSPIIVDDLVKGAKPGMFINTITEELMTEVEVIPCAFQRRFLQWAPRSEGGGYRGQHNPVDVETGKIEGLHQGQNEKGKDALMIGSDELKDTRHHFVLMRSASGAWQPALVSMASTQVKKSKRFMSLIQGIEMHGANGKAFNPPAFSHRYKMVSVKEENNQGKWHGFSISLVGPVEDANVYAKAKAFHADVAKGKVETAPPESDEPSGDDVPF